MKVFGCVAVFIVLVVTAEGGNTSPYTPEPLQMVLPFVTRWSGHDGWSDGGPCKRNDYRCMNAMALKYINEQRKRSGRKLHKLKMGTMAMLKNAMAHNRRMQRRGRLYHQNLRKTKLGCRSFFSGENVAQTHCLLNRKGGPTDPAKMCSEQLRKSPPHYKNIISDYHRQFVMGVWVDKKGYIWCTQLFTVFTKYSGGNCKKCPGGSGGGKKKVKKEKKGMQSSTGHYFKNKIFRDQYDDGYVEVYHLKCNYCASGDMCLTERESVAIDKKL